MKKITGLDTLRAFAVIFVIIEHFGVWFDDTSPSGIFIKNVLIPDGGFGVHLFFVLSGFLITSILFNAKNSKYNTHRFYIIKNFYIRRALRIFPIYYLLIILLLIDNYPDFKNNIWFYLTYTTNFLCWHSNVWNSFSHTWTLAVEEQFYLIWPWLILYIKNKYFKYVVFTAILIGIISTYFAIEVQARIGTIMVYNCIDAFAIGAFYSWAKLEKNRNDKFIKTIKQLAFIALTFYFYSKLTNNHIINYPAIPHFSFLIKTINSIISVWLIMLVVNNRSKWVDRFLLKNRFLNYIGKISYGIYLYHYVYINGYCNPINKFIYQITLPYPTINHVVHDHHFDYWLEVAIMISIAALSYKFIEKPILAFKNKYNYLNETNTINIE